MTQNCCKLIYWKFRSWKPLYFVEEVTKIQFPHLSSVAKRKSILPAEYAMTATEVQQIDHLINGALMALGHYSMQRLEWTRFGRLLLTLRSLCLKSFDTSLKQLFNHIIDGIVESEWKMKRAFRILVNF